MTTDDIFVNLYVCEYVERTMSTDRKTCFNKKKIKTCFDYDGYVKQNAQVH